MNATAVSRLLFAAGRRAPRLPVALLRAMPLGFFRALRAPGLRATLRLAARSPYYREAFAAAGADPDAVRRLEDLRGFRLEPHVLKGSPERLLCGRPDLAVESSGTSGHVTRVYLDRDELEYSAAQGGLLYALWGMGPRDRLLCTLDLAWGLGALLVERGVRHTGLFAMVPGRVDPVEAHGRMAQYRFNVLVSDPFWLGRFTEVAAERGRPGPVKLLVGGGEGITARTREELERFWGAPVVMTYASTEAATILGFECLERRGYHVNEFDFHVEVDAPDAGGYGEILLTTAHRRVMPLIRYRTGDVARWLDGPCRCGLAFRRLSPLRGRLDEQVSCVWGNVHPEFFEPLLAGVPGLGADWQVALGERGLRPVFQFRLEQAGGPAERDAAARSVLGALERLAPEAWLAHRQALVDVEFRFFTPGTLRRARKLLRLVDERGSAAPDWVEAGVESVGRR